MHDTHITGVMRKLERQGHEAVLLVRQTLDAGAVPAHRESRTGRDDVVRSELVTVSDTEPKDVLPWPQWHAGETAFDSARRVHGLRRVTGT